MFLHPDLGAELPDRYYGADCLISMPGNPTTWFKNVYDDPCTNIERGSNLIEGSHVECDASVMYGESGAFGAAGALPGCCLATKRTDFGFITFGSNQSYV